jgi:hypothetical protein
VLEEPVVRQAKIKRHLFLLAGTMTLLGLALFLYKVLVHDFPLRPGKEVHRWDLVARVHFTADGAPTKVWLTIPTGSQDLYLVDERFVSRGHGVNTISSEVGRKVAWTKREARGEQVLYYRATFGRLHREQTEGRSAEAPSAAAFTLTGPELAAAQADLDVARGLSSDRESLIHQVLKILSAEPADPNAALLIGSSPGREAIIGAARQVLSLDGVPARTLWGLQLFQVSERAVPEPWLQFYDDGAWRILDPATEGAGHPGDLLGVGYGEGPLFGVEGGGLPSVRWSVRSPGPSTSFSCSRSCS